MAYNEKLKRDDNTNCVTHRWPKSGMSGSFRSIGSVEHQQCNNCLATKIVFTTDVQTGPDVWERVTDERLIEPKFSQD